MRVYIELPYFLAKLAFASRPGWADGGWGLSSLVTLSVTNRFDDAPSGWS